MVAGSVAHQSFRGGIGTSISTKVGIGDVVRAQLEGFTHPEVRGEWFARSVLFCDEHSVNLSCAPKKTEFLKMALGKGILYRYHPLNLPGKISFLTPDPYLR